MYQLTACGEFARDYGLREQVRRAAVSVMSNIAEGFERGSDRQLRHFLLIAKGSVGEVKCQLYIAHDVGYISEEQFSILMNKTTEIGRMLAGFMRYLEQNDKKG